MASTARLDELKKKFDENPRRYFAPLANEHRKSGDLDQAIALCRAHLPQQPAHISGHIVLAQALFEAGSLDEARDIFHTALGLDQENLIALRYLGDIARDANDVETARGWYQRVLEVDPRNDEIVQIVRDLDAPRAEPVVEQPVAAAPEPEAPAAPSTPIAAAAKADRFAPIPIESLELDELNAPPSITSQDIPDDEPTAPEAPIDVHADWNVDAPSMDLATLDTPGVDPFDLHPAGSAESLFDMGSAAPADDFFLTELSGSSHIDSSGFDVTEPNATETWAPAEPEPAAAAPVAEAQADAAAFEEGAFYIEEAPSAPAESVPEPISAEAVTTAMPAAETPVSELPTFEMVAETPAPVETPSFEMTTAYEETVDVAPLDVASLDAAAFELPEAPHAESASEAPAESFSSVDESHAVVELADRPTAEWQAPQVVPDEVPSSNHSDLGLEVMEFVPPSSESSAPQGATPAAFVTETMAELYLQQGFRNEALAVYRELLARNPADASLRERIEQIEIGSMSSLGLANVSETVIESALKRQSARSAKSVRSFFASLAGRRAPMQSAAPSTDHTDSTAYADEYVAQDAVQHAEPQSTEIVPEALAPVAELSAPERVAPMSSAAETLASFDPFADTQESVSETSLGNSTDSVFGMDDLGGMAAPNAEPMAAEPMVAEAPAPEPVEPLPSSEPQARRSLEDLFPDTAVAPRSEAAAQTLATAFGRTEPQGRPTRAANSELSLDKVFRGAPEGAPPSDGGFSFDQFFSDARPSGGSDVAAPAISPPETGRSAGAAGDAHDIEQFTAWLEGLKKK